MEFLAVPPAFAQYRFRLPRRSVRRLVLSHLWPAAGVYFALTVAVGLAGCASPARNGTSISLEKFVGTVQALETKDYYLNLESPFKFTDASGIVPALDHASLPRTKSQLLRLLDRWRLRYFVDGDVIVVQDPALTRMPGHNPMDLTIPRIGRDKVGLEAIASSFDITVGGRVRLIGDTRPEPGERVTLEHTGPLSLRQALNQITREYHLEWGTGVMPADDTPPYVTRPDGSKALNIFANGGVRITVEEEQNWHKATPAREAGQSAK